MVFNPDISFFISFNDLDPSTQKQCIFFTQKGARCKSNCRDQDNERAIELQHLLKATPVEDINIKILSEYAQCNCCLWKRAQHRDKIEDLQLLTPLAQRWLNEIRAQPVLSLNKAKPPFAVTQPALSEFRRHIVEPSPGDSVYQKMLTPLKKRDFETGSLYIFDRESSPGHVKIGWTAKTVSDRLADWSNCGYEPNLLFSLNDIPHAHRVETLTHYELIKEWRRERRCKAPWCGKSHQEWFEVSKELAKQTVRDWAGFVQSAKPYDLQGHLKDQWKDVIKGIYRETKEVTARRLLSRFREIVISKTIATEKGVGQLPVPKTGKEITRLLPRAKPSKVSEAEYVVKVEQTESQSNDFKEIPVKDFESDILIKPEFAQEVKTTRTEVKHKTVAAKVWHMPKNISLAVSPRIDLKSPHISASSLQCVEQRPHAEVKQLSGKDITLHERSSPAVPGYNLTTNSWVFPSNIDPNTQTKVLT
ncbi:hypothetical protein F1880_007642 [Penicillium rolfsii]|nr:hypothetical protein F1880_007642 [Penicillium rolfsii]